MLRVRPILLSLLILFGSACEIPQASVGQTAPVQVWTGAKSGSYGPLAEQRYDLYVPANPVGLIVFVHGGAWIGGNRSGAMIPNSVGAQRSKGWAVMSIDYRLAPGATIPTQVSDVALAVAYAKSKMASWKMAGRPVVLAGHSAGGHLAVLEGVSWNNTKFLPTNVRAEDTRPDAVIDLAGIVDVGLWGVTTPVIFGSAAPATVNKALGCGTSSVKVLCSASTLRAVDPRTYLDARDPSAFLSYGQQDPIVPVSQGSLLYTTWRKVRGDNYVWFDTHAGNHDVLTVNSAGLSEFLAKVSSHLL